MRLGSGSGAPLLRAATPSMMRLVPRVADSLTASISALPAGRLRRRLPAYVVGVAAAALLTRALAAVLPMELAAAWAVVVAIGIPGWAALRLAGLDRRLGAAEAVAVLPVAALTVWAVPLALGMLTGVPFVAVEVVVLAAGGLRAGRLRAVRPAAGGSSARLPGWPLRRSPPARSAGTTRAGRARATPSSTRAASASCSSWTASRCPASPPT